MSTPAVGSPSGSYPKQPSLAPGRMGWEDFHSGPLTPAHEAALSVTLRRELEEAMRWM